VDFELLDELVFKSDDIFALFVHVLMIAGASFEIISIRFDPFNLPQKLIAPGSQRIPLVLHGFQLGTLSFLFAKWLVINGYHDGHYQKQETEFTESHQATQSAIDMLGWLRCFDVKFFVFHGNAASGGCLN